MDNDPRAEWIQERRELYDRIQKLEKTLLKVTDRLDRMGPPSERMAKEIRAATIRDAVRGLGRKLKQVADDIIVPDLPIDRTAYLSAKEDGLLEAVETLMTMVADGGVPPAVANDPPGGRPGVSPDDGRGL